MIKDFIQQLMQHQSLTSEQCYLALESLSEKLIPEQAAAFLALLHSKPETSAELQGFVTYLQEKMHYVAIQKPVLDIVGTGGDGSHTVNISSAASLVCASLGVHTAKHGNRSVSSRCGSADFMAALGITIDLNPKQAADLLQQCGFAFLYAPNFHPVLGQFKELRQALGVPTTFNLVGPLLNPTQPDYLVLGVYHPRLLPIYAAVVSQSQVKRALIVHSCGLDEASLLGKTTVVEVNASHQQQYTIELESLPLPSCKLSDIQGDDAEHNRALIMNAFSGEPSAIANTIALNSALGLYASHYCDTINQGITIAKEQLQSKKVLNYLRKVVDCSNQES